MIQRMPHAHYRIRRANERRDAVDFLVRVAAIRTNVRSSSDQITAFVTKHLHDRVGPPIVRPA
jgi:hypothetical protein